MHKASRIDLNWNFLEYFCRVADHRSLKSAADELGVSSSTISEGIQSLERSLDRKLLARNTRKVELTAQGQALFNRIKPFFGSQYEILESLQMHPSRQLPVVSVGLIPSDAFDIASDIMNEIVRYESAAKFQIRHTDPDGLERMLNSGEVDIGISNALIRGKILAGFRVAVDPVRYFVKKDLAHLPAEELFKNLKLGLLGSGLVRARVLNDLANCRPDLDVQLLVTDYPSLLFDLCQKGRVLMASASRRDFALSGDLAEVSDPTLRNLGYMSELYLIIANRIMDSDLAAHLRTVLPPK